MPLSLLLAVVGLVALAAAAALLLVPAAGLAVAGVELLWLSYALEHPATPGGSA